MRRSREARSSPSTYSMVKKVCPSTSPTSYTRHTLGWETRRAIRTSFLKRSSMPSWLVPFSGGHLLGHRRAQGQIVGAIDFAHTAFAEQGNNAIPSRDKAARKETSLADQVIDRG